MLFKKKNKPNDEEDCGGVNWKRVLHEIYEFAPHRYGCSKEGFTKEHPLAKKLKISGQELGLSMLFLKQQGLLKFGKDRFILLTEKGFAVALENEKSLLNLTTTHGVFLFTFLLVLVTMINIMLSLLGSHMLYFVAILFILTIVCFSYLLMKVELR